MRVKKINRYYCDHCKKATCQKAAMTRHENGCLRNPNRVCGFCAESAKCDLDTHQLTLATLITVLQEGGLERLKEDAKNCPGCCFAAIIQSRESQCSAESDRMKTAGVPKYEREFSYGMSQLESPVETWEPKEGWIYKDSYDFEVEKVAFWNKVNESKEGICNGGYL